MDPPLDIAAHALRRGDALAALAHVARREDATALALRGIAMAQLGELPRARQLLRRAARAFQASDVVAHARCLLAEAEAALAARDLRATSLETLEVLARTLASSGDHDNAIHARLVRARTLLLRGAVADAEHIVTQLDTRRLSPTRAATAHLLAFDVALRRDDVHAASEALARADAAATHAGVFALSAEIAAAATSLAAPVARLVTHRASRSVSRDEAARAARSSALVVDARKRIVRERGDTISLARRPVLFALLRALAEAHPEDVPRDALIASAFGARRTHPSLRARLRVEVGRLRHAISPVAALTATKRGFAIVPRRAQDVLVLAPLVEDSDTALLGLLMDGTSWSSSALAIALGESQRTVQRALVALERKGAVRSHGRGPSRAWVLAPTSEIATTLLLPVSAPIR